MEGKKKKNPDTSFAKKIQDGKMRNDGYGETRHMFNKLKGGVKGSVDHKKPDTYPIIKRMKKNKNANTYEEEQHLKNIQHMNRRIKSIGSYQQRKKNIHDPLVNPPKLFRQVGDEKGVSIQKLAKKLKGEGTNNLKTEQFYEKEISKKQKVLEKKKKAQLRKEKSDTESVFDFEEVKGTEALPGQGDEELSQEEREIYEAGVKGFGDPKMPTSDVVPNPDEKYSTELINNIPLIKFKKQLQGGWPEKYKIFGSVCIDYLLENEICSDRKINEFFNKFCLTNKKFFPNYDLSIKILKQVLKDLEAENAE